MGEDDNVELILKSGQIVSSSQTQTDPPILRGSGSSGGDGGENAPVPPPAPPPPLQHHQHIFIHEDEMASWLHHRHQENYFYSDLLYSGVVAASQPQISISLAPPPPPPASQIIAARRVENFTNFARLRGNLLTGAGPLIPVLRDSTQVDSSGTPSSSVAVSCLTPATQGIGGVSHTFAVPGRSWKAKEVAIETVCEIAGTSSSVVCKAETEPINIRPATETEIAGEEDRKRKEREETEETEEAPASTTTSRKRSRAAEMHNLSERRRREKINDRMKALQELIPRSNKSDKASLLEDAIEYVKSLQMQIQMMSVGGGVMPVMYTPDMQRFMPMGMMGMNRPPLIPFPNQGHVEGLGPSYPAPRYPFPAYDPSRPNPVWNQPQFPGYMNPYSQFIGLQQMQQPPPLLNQTTSQPSFGQASSSKEPEVQENQPTG